MIRFAGSFKPSGTEYIKTKFNCLLSSTYCVHNDSRLHSPKTNPSPCFSIGDEDIVRMMNWPRKKITVRLACIFHPGLEPSFLVASRCTFVFRYLQERMRIRARVRQDSQASV